MKEKIGEYFAGIVKNLGFDDAVILIESPESAIHGDYTTNVAMTLAGRLKEPPRKIAEKIVDRIKDDQKKSLIPWLDRAEIAGPGFINLFMTEASFSTTIEKVLKEKERYGQPYYTPVTQKRAVKKGSGTGGKTPPTASPSTPQNPGQKNDTSGDGNERETYAPAAKGSPKPSSASFGKKTIMVEFAHPNTHKAFHIGHLRNITTGESVVRLLESQGHTVIRANYQGDVGMHIAKALYALTTLEPFRDQVHSVTGIKNRVEFLGKAYAAGSASFEESDDVKKTVGDINKKIYAKDPSVYDLYRETRQWSLDYFETIYARVSSHFDRYYFESETYETGRQYVLDGVARGIFQKSDGAVIFPGEKFGLHNRVFISSEGNATYEGKDMGLGRLQFDEYNPDMVTHCVGPEQAGYFQVIFEALAQLFPDTRGREHHLIYGWVKLKEGKMSSRLGNVVLGEWLIDEVKKEILKIVESNTIKQIDIDKNEVSEALAIGAVKYAFLKVSTPSEIAFDLKESVNINGDSGPYLQYTYARAKSVLRKAGEAAETGTNPEGAMNPEERTVARLIMQFPDIVSEAANRYAPNTVCTYLFQLAQAFNLLYAKHAIIGNPFRLALSGATAQVVHNGLYVLGITTPEKM